MLHLFKDGGLLFTLPITLLFLLIIVMFILAFNKRNENKKMISLIASIAWFTIAWAYLGRTIGMIQSFDAIAAVGEITPKIVAPGIKMIIVSPLFGLITFVIAQIGIIVLKLRNKKEFFEN